MSRRLLLAGVALLGLGCRDEPAGPPDPTPVARVALTPAADSVLLDGTVTIGVRAEAADGREIRGRPVTWSLEDSALARVSPTGVVTALAPGRIVVRAAVDGVSGTASLTSHGLRFVSLTAGNEATCGLTTDEAVYCWGSNRYGQLGTGSPDTSAAFVPRRVATNARIAQAALGGATGCLATVTGEGWCWGERSTRTNGAPERVGEGLTFSALVPSGLAHTCGLATDGRGYCWGNNTYGQVGDGTRLARNTPVSVSGGHLFAQISSGGVGHTCARDLSGRAWCWGDDTAGQLGHDTTYGSLTPVPTGPLPAASSPSASEHRTCVLAAGEAWCWGGKPFHHARKLRVLPEVEAGGLGLLQVSEGWQHTCALDASDTAWCWGANAHGQLGRGTLGQQNVEYAPTSVVGGKTFQQIAAGELFHTCALDTAGAAWCWGDGGSGQLGDGGTSSRSAPVAVSAGIAFGSISAGEDLSCGVAVDGTGYCWGLAGAIGSPVTTNQLTPVRVDGGLRFDVIHAGGGFSTPSCGLTTTGEAWCWGSGRGGALGNGTTDDSAVPVPVFGGHTFTRLSVARGRACAVTSGGEAWCWGANRAGANGDGTITNSLVPVRVASGLTFTDIAAGYEHTCGTASGGVVHCWGDNRQGQFGNGVTTDSPVPVAVIGGLAFARIETGGYSTCGLTVAGDSYCWPSTATRGPQLVSHGRQYRDFAPGDWHTCAVATDGAVYCWGSNHFGQLGDGRTSQSLRPVRVLAGFDAASIVVGLEHSCALSTAGEAWCWGANHYGQLGVRPISGGIVYPVRVSGQLPPSP